MSEKRFKGYAEKTGQHFELIINDLLGEEYSLTDDFFKSKDVIFEIVDLLNVMNNTLLKQADENHKLSNKNIEQQSTIEKQDEEIRKLKKTERSWRKIHCCNKESNNCGIVIEQQNIISKLESDLQKIPPKIRELWIGEE